MALARLDPDFSHTPHHPTAPKPGAAGTPECTAFHDSLRAAGVQVVIPAHSVLFVQGDEAAGIHLLHAGQVKYTMYSSRGRTLILKISEAGELLGLHNCLAQARYEVSAESLQRCEITFVRRDDFFRLLAREPQVLQAVAGQLSRECHAAYGVIHALATSNCISERLARLLLELAATESRGPSPESRELSASSRDAGLGTRVSVGLTHEEIAQMIGTSRETVTRLLKQFRTRRLATLKGSTLHILDKPALEQMVPAESRVASRES